MKRKKYQIIEGKYTFQAEDDWGDYNEGKYREGTHHDKGYRYHWYDCTDGKRHHIYEHVAKWEFFNGKIPEGFEIDHIIPIKNGGTNRLSNLRLVTHPENLNNPISFKNRSDSHKGKPAWNKGIKCSEETKKKISAAKRKKG